MPGPPPGAGVPIADPPLGARVAIAGPPPGAGVAIALISEAVPVVDVAGEAAGLAPPLVKRLSQDFLAGLAEALAAVDAAVSFFLDLAFAAGDSAGEEVSVGDADSAASVFLECLRFAAGDSAGEALSDGDADSAVSFFLECLCFAAGEAAGDSAGEGLWANRAVAANVSAIAE
jgi:hypothetical protein